MQQNKVMFYNSQYNPVVLHAGFFYFVKMRDSFIIYRSFYDAISDLTKDQQADVYNAICAFSLDQKEPELTGVSSTIFKLIKPQLEANYKRYENGKQPKTKQEKSKTEAKRKQNGSKTEANKNVNVNDNVNNNEKVNDTEKDFNKSKSFKHWTNQDFLNSVSELKESYTKDMLNEFYIYWTEKSASGKMKFQLQETWETSKRLLTWSKNQEKFNKSSPQDNPNRGGSKFSKAL